MDELIDIVLHFFLWLALPVAGVAALKFAKKFVNLVKWKLDRIERSSYRNQHPRI